MELLLKAVSSGEIKWLHPGRDEGSETYRINVTSPAVLVTCKLFRLEASDSGWLKWLKLTSSEVRNCYSPEIPDVHRWKDADVKRKEPEYLHTLCGLAWWSISTGTFSLIPAFVVCLGDVPSAESLQSLGQSCACLFFSPAASWPASSWLLPLLVPECFLSFCQLYVIFIFCTADSQYYTSQCTVAWLLAFRISPSNISDFLACLQKCTSGVLFLLLFYFLLQADKLQCAIFIKNSIASYANSLYCCSTVLHWFPAQFWSLEWLSRAACSNSCW